MYAPFSQEVYIRLAEDNSSFVCTIKYGAFYSKITEVELTSQRASEIADTMAPVVIKRRYSHWASEDE